MILVCTSVDGKPSSSLSRKIEIGDSLKSVFSSLGSVFSKIFSGGGFSGILSGLGHIFGGFLTGSGDVQPGRSYVVGEERPELFIPRAAGTIVPTLAGVMASGPSFTSVVHFNGVADADSFRASQNSILNQITNAQQRAFGHR